MGWKKIGSRPCDMWKGTEMGHSTMLLRGWEREKSGEGIRGQIRKGFGIKKF